MELIFKISLGKIAQNKCYGSFVLGNLCYKLSMGWTWKLSTCITTVLKSIVNFIFKVNLYHFLLGGCDLLQFIDWKVTNIKHLKSKGNNIILIYILITY